MGTKMEVFGEKRGVRENFSLVLSFRKGD